MSISPRKLISEVLRQQNSKDYNYLLKFIYFFELKVPDELAAQHLAAQELGPMLFPLIVGPNSYTLSEPFSVESTPTQGGGLIVEENGIIQRTIKLEGNTGFKPRGLSRNGNVASLLYTKPQNRSYSRTLPWFTLDAISGQRHFQYLQDAVFRTYADLKRDPATSEGTYLIFHNPKDDEHWLVVPRDFTLTRSASSPVMYNYSIDLLVVDRAEAVYADFSEDQGLIDAVKNAVAMVKAGLALVSGAINDITALVGEITNFVKDIGKIIDGVTEIVEAAGNFANGLSALIESPYTLIESVTGLVDAAGETLEKFEDLGSDVKKFPDTVKQKFKQLGDGLDLIGAHPEVFENPAIALMRQVRAAQELASSTSRATLESAAASLAPASFSEVDALGTGITPGDVTSSRGELGIGRAVMRYTSSITIDIGQGDTLTNLAARYLGDARLWQQIAVVNGLRPPFMNDLASTPLDTDEPVFGGTLGVGAKILIPSFVKPPQNRPLLPVLGVRAEESSEDHLLGTDLKLERVGGRDGAPMYDFAVDVERGSVDIKTVSGVANISQSIISRISTDRGSDILYKKVGLRRVIGLHITPLDLELVHFRFRECINQDPRVSSVRSLTISSGEGSDPPDAIIVDADVELVGFTQSVNVRVVVGG